MNISFNIRDAVSAVLKIEITKEDYAAQVERALRDFRRDTDIPGFRKGFVPMDIVRKKYKKVVLPKEIQQLVSDGLYNYILENKLNVLGNPMSSDEQKEIDFEKQDDFEFCFDLAIAPKMELEWSHNDTLSYYQVVVNDDAVNKRIASYRATFGTYDNDVEDVEEKDMVKGVATELASNGAPREGGLTVDNAVAMPMYFKSEEDKQAFLAAKKGDTLTFNPHRAFGGTEAEIASFLRVDRETAGSFTGDFGFEVKEITHYKEADLNQELYDKIFPNEAVTDEEAFRDKIRQSLCKQYEAQSNYRFFIDARPLLLAKVAHLAFPEDILKRWMVDQDLSKTSEQIDEHYPRMIEDLKIKLIIDTITDENNLSVEEEDMEAVARQMARSQFSQYGMPMVTDDVISDYAKDMLKNQKVTDDIIDRVKEEKFANWLKNAVQLDIKEVLPDEFVAMLQSAEQQQPE